MHETTFCSLQNYPHNHLSMNLKFIMISLHTMLLELFLSFSTSHSSDQPIIQKFCIAKTENTFEWAW